MQDNRHSKVLLPAPYTAPVVIVTYLLHIRHSPRRDYLRRYQDQPAAHPGNRQRIQGTACSYPEAQAYQPRQDGDQSANLHNTFTFTLGQSAQLLRGSRRNVNRAGRGFVGRDPRKRPSTRSPVITRATKANRVTKPVAQSAPATVAGDWKPQEGYCGKASSWKRMALGQR